MSCTSQHVAKKPRARDCAIITWRVGWETRGGHRGKSHIERGGLDVKFNIYGGGHYFLLVNAMKRV